MILPFPNLGFPHCHRTIPLPTSNGEPRRRAFAFWLWVVFVAFAPGPSAHSQAIRNSAGFRSASLPRTDDGYSGEVPIGFAANFFGRTYSSLYVNNNGNITFGGPLGAYVPFGLAKAHMPIVAAFFADVDTRAPQSGFVTYGRDTIDGHRAFGVDYFRVGRFESQADKLNTFQLILIERPETGAGNFDIEFNYGQIAWDTGSASQNVSAVAGFSNGTGQANSLFELPGSMQNGAFLDGGPRSLVRGKLNSNLPGRYIFQARSGAVSQVRIVTPQRLPDAVVDRPYSFSALKAEGGTAPYSWTASDWPPELGLHLDPSTGVISGTPRRAGSYQLAVRVNDSAASAPAAQTFQLVVSDNRGSSLIPFLIEPGEAQVGTSVRIVAGLHYAPQDPAIRIKDLPEPFTMELKVEDQTIPLRSDSPPGDSQADHGRYVGDFVFRHSGIVPVTLIARGQDLNLQARAEVRVVGTFIARVSALDIDLGTMRENSESCRPLIVPADQVGEVLFTLESLRRTPAEHRLEIRLDGKVLSPGGPPLMLPPSSQHEPLPGYREASAIFRCSRRAEAASVGWRANQSESRRGTAPALASQRTQLLAALGLVGGADPGRADAPAHRVWLYKSVPLLPWPRADVRAGIPGPG